MNLERLSDKFLSKEIEWRIGQHGAGKDGKVWCKVLAYIQSRAIMQRLDDVCGPLNWRNEFREWHGTSQLCGISIRHPESGEWITKWDGADNTDIESTKGGLSDAMKRAAVQWGIGRYLYQLDETFVEQISMERPKEKDGWNYAYLGGTAKTNKSGNDIRYYWHRPALPSWALPGDEPKKPKSPPKSMPRGKNAKNLAEALDNLGCGDKAAKEAFCQWMSEKHGIAGLSAADFADEQTAADVLDFLRQLKKDGWDAESIKNAIVAMA